MLCSVTAAAHETADPSPSGRQQGKAFGLQGCHDSVASRSTTLSAVEKAQKRQAQAEEKLRQKLQKQAEKKQHEWSANTSAFGDLHESSDDEDEEVEQTEENTYGPQVAEQVAPSGAWKKAPQITEVTKTPEELAASVKRGQAFLARVKARKAAQGNKSWADIADDYDEAQKTQQKKVSWADMAESSDEEDSDEEW